MSDPFDALTETPAPSGSRTGETSPRLLAAMAGREAAGDGISRAEDCPHHVSTPEADAWLTSFEAHYTAVGDDGRALPASEQ